MNARAILALGLSALFFCAFVAGFSYGDVKSSVANPVHNINTGLNYTSIQGAIDAPETVNGHTILVDSGTYNTPLVVDKSLRIIGSGRNTTVINGVGGFVVHVVARDVLIEGFSMKGGSGVLALGVYFDHSDNSVLRDNNVSGVNAGADFYGVYAAYSNNLTIDQNIIGPDSSSGILITNSLDFRVSDNYVHDNIGYGINANASSNGLIMGNDVIGNSYDGIGLSRGCQNITITGNTIEGPSEFGLHVIDRDCVDNVIYDNNFISNSKQASVVSTNRWDNGVEGNFWSDYAGVDQDHDGIGDSSYGLNENNTDNYPLMGNFSVFETSLGFNVDVISNSSIATFSYFLWNGTITMHVKSNPLNQAFGFCRVRLSHGLMTEPYNVTVDGATPLSWNSTLYDDGGSRWIYFLYGSSNHEVLIRGRSPPPTVSIISPENKTYTVSDVPLTFTVNEETSWLAYSLDGQSNMTISGNTTLPGVSNGTHTLVLYARNSFGDVSTSGIVYFSVSAGGLGLFPFLLATAVAIVVILVVAFVYLRKLRRRRGKNG
ncbi:MAG: NosD domain-containing protein [Candidatus Bathyarchaeia archaeon]